MGFLVAKNFLRNFLGFHNLSVEKYIAKKRVCGAMSSRSKHIDEVRPDFRPRVVLRLLINDF